MTPRFLNLVIRGLPLQTTKEDVLNHIEALTMGCQPLVGPIVRDSQSEHLTSTTVRLTMQGSNTENSIISQLEHSEFLGLPNRIHLDKDFYGLSTIAEHPGSTLDVCFVHGLGGHAFDTWTDQSQFPTYMWPRDFLPERFAREGIKARFLTYGHRADVLRNADPQATITTAAQELLSHLIADRTKNPDRPIYFIAHSLGGLVVCQAMINCLCKDPGFSRKRDYEKLFSQPDNCLVKGMVFFGCPFRGSSQANFVYPIIKLLAEQYLWPVNKNLVKSLKEKSIGLGQIVGRFNRIRKREDIQLLICCETDQVPGTGLTTTADSAIGAFDSDVAPIRINSNHVKMVKFVHNQDSSYRTVETRIVEMVKVQTSRAMSLSDSWSQSPGSNVDSDSLHRITSPGEGEYSAGFPHRHPRYTSASSSGHYGDVPNSLTGSNGYPHQHGTHNQSAPNLTRQNPSAIFQEPDPIDDMRMQDHTKLSRLTMFDTVFIIDDTGSMQKPVNYRQPELPDRWTTMKDGLQNIWNIAAKFDEDGVDLFFLKNSRREDYGIKDGNKISALLEKFNLSDPISAGGTFFRDQLRRAIEPRMEEFRQFKDPKRAKSGTQLPKPLNLIVLTDGEADDEEEVEEYLVDVAIELDKLKAPKRHLGIQFVQVGDDTEAREYLKRLDDDLHGNYKNEDGQGIRDIIDTTYFGKTSTTSFQKILLGAVTNWLDKEDDSY